MKIHSLIQGSPEWLAYRREMFNASDAPAMMGCSAYKTRTELLREMKSGIAQEVDAGTQQLFDDGHRAEALARPLAEEIIGDTLYPVTGSEGKFSASFDGLTLEYEIGYEHKALNKALREAIRQQGGNANEFLAPMYRIQMEQQCMVSGAKRILFMASKWSADGTLIEERHCWYTPDPELRSKIVAGWAQFEEDLRAFDAEHVEPPKPTGKAPDSLPALRIEVSGSVTASNLAEFKETALAAIGSVNRNLQTDSDFADAEKAVKWCEEVESRLKAAKDHALSQTESIDMLFKTMDDISAEARRVRLDLDKLVKARKESIKAEIVNAGILALRKHIDDINGSMPVNYMPTVPADFAGCIKGLRTVESIRNAVDTELARAKVHAGEIANRIHANFASIQASGLACPDTSSLVLKAPDDLAAILAQRKAEEDKRLEAQRERIRQEEEARAAAKAQAAQQPAPAPAPEPVKVAAVKVPAAPVFAHPQELTGQRIKLGDINARLYPMSVTVEGLASIGFKPVGSERAAKLYDEAQFPAICRALAARLEKACEPIEA